MEGPKVRIDLENGRPVEFGGRVLTPRAQSVRLTLPVLKGGIIWRRPHSVLIQGSGGEETSLPVVDVTRAAQIAVLLAGVLTVSLIWFLRRSHNDG